MKNFIGFIFAGMMVVLGLLLIFIGTSRPIKILTDSSMQTIYTRALKVEQALDQAGISLGPYDRIAPSLDDRLGWEDTIVITRARQVRIIDETRGVDISIPSIERQPANLLLEVGISLFPKDQIYWSGTPINPSLTLPPRPSYTLQVIPAQEVTIQINELLTKTSSAKLTLAQVLWDMGIKLHNSDYTSIALISPLDPSQPVEVFSAKNVEIQFGDQTLTLLTAAPTVGLALRQAGIAIQGMDIILPAENQPVPEDGVIQVVRVSEELVIEQTVLPYASETVLDPDVELDQRRVIQAGQYGLEVKRERIRYENGKEVKRSSDAEWVALAPTNEVIGFGTQLVMKIVDTPEGPKEYWRSVTAYATSYSPCRSGIDGCSYNTASGAPVQKGIVAVMCSLFSTYRGQQVFVPGYGVGIIGDCGGGGPWSFWIDLAYNDEEYESWHDYVTLFFLAPPLETIPYDFP